MQRQKTLQLKGQVIDLSQPIVMGIVNITPDSFFKESRIQKEENFRKRIEQIIQEGAKIVDIGAYSSRPSSTPLTEEEELNRLRPMLEILKKEYPNILFSVDTFRSSIAQIVVEEYGACLINDISGGVEDKNMFPTIGKLQIPYILMHLQGGIANMHQEKTYSPSIENSILDYFNEKISLLRDFGAKDIILDPGFGFSKSMEDNYRLLAHSKEIFNTLGLPTLTGISRKRMVWMTINKSPQEALNGTSVLHTFLLLNKATDILRVHDVKEAIECIQLTQTILSSN